MADNSRSLLVRHGDHHRRRFSVDLKCFEWNKNKIEKKKIKIGPGRLRNFLELLRSSGFVSVETQRLRAITYEALRL